MLNVGKVFDNLYHQAHKRTFELVTLEIPLPPNEAVEAMLFHPQSKFAWSGNTLIITNPNLAAAKAEFNFIDFGAISTDQLTPYMEACAMIGRLKLELDKAEKEIVQLKEKLNENVN